MKNIIKIFTLLIALLTVTNTADARLRGDAATRVTTGSIIGGRLDYYSDAKCETKLGTDVAAGSTVYIKATANWDKRLGAADANGKVSFITAEQTINSGAAQTRGEIGLGDYVDVVLVESRLDVGIYKLVMPTDANIGVKVSAQFVDPAPNQSIQFTSIADKYSVDENAAVGTLVAQMTVVDKTKADGAYEGLNYTLNSDYGADTINELFEVNEVNNFAGVRTVEILVKNQEELNHESHGSINVKLYVENKSGNYNIAQFYININDLNEDFTLSDQTFTLAEKQKDGSDWDVETYVGDVEIRYRDHKYYNDFTWKVIDTGIPFDFYQGTNELMVTDESVLDYETKTTWSFKISVSDDEYTHYATITVNLTDVNEAPQISDCKNEYAIDENSATGKDFGSFTVSDPDAGDELTYSLTGALTGAADATVAKKNLSDIFVLKETKNSGVKRIVAIKVKDGAQLDYEKLYNSSKRNATYPATITITDKASNSVDVTTNITVVDVNEDLTATGGTFYIKEHSPGLSHVSTTKYNEDPNEADYGYVTGTDNDKYNKSFSTLTYTISTANTNAQAADAAKFFIDPNDGSIFTAANAKFEYDGDKPKRSYTFLVTVSDGTFSKDVSVTVNVLNIEEPPINQVTEGSGRVREDAAKGTLVATFDKTYITDEEELAKFEAIGDGVKFRIDETSSGYGVFKADETTGDIYLVDPSKIDFETLGAKDASCRTDGTSPMYEVKMTASNADGSVSLDITRYIEIVDVNEAPTASNLTETVDENIPGGTVIGTIVASDPDKYAFNIKLHSYGFKKLHYSIVDASGLPFEIDQNSGEIKLKKNERLSYAENTQYKFDVKVSDRATSEAALSTIAHVTINVKDINEPSEFVTLNDVYEVNENVDKGTVVGDYIVVYDEDGADVNNLKITLNNAASIENYNAAHLFEVVQEGKTNSNSHKSTFAIKTKANLDYEAILSSKGNDIFVVMLTIEDKAGNKITLDCQIRVIDVNEEPAFDKDSYTFMPNENTPAYDIIGEVITTDPDNNTLYYSLEGDDAAQFTIDANGKISTVKGTELDYETKDTYKFYAVVTDKKHTVKVPVTVNVGNENEDPKFAEEDIVLLVDESAEKGTVIGTVTATDDDTKNGKAGKAPTYSLKYGREFQDGFLFDINESTGEITVKEERLADFNTKREYRICVSATDGDDTSYGCTKDIVIKARLKMENLFSAGSAFTSYVAPENMAVPEGLSAYAVTDIDGTSATIQQIDYLPQSVPVLIKRADKTENLYKATTGNGTAFYVNKLMINETDREVSAGELYLLYRDEFVLTSSGTLPAGSVYLPITDLAVKTRSLTIGNGEGTTSIENLTPAPSESEGEWYDLQGRRLGNKPNRKGIYISNGRKVVIK